jgi:hypothetical protein
MAKYELKTKKTEASVEDFINSVEDEAKREDCRKVAEMMQKASGAEPKMWGANIVGFGSFLYKNTSGSYDWMEIGFSPRKANLTIYLMSGFKRFDELLGKLGKHSTGKSCLYIKRLSDVDEEILKEMIENSIENVRKGNIEY